MGLYQEFKTFISRGNVVDLAVGVIIGGAFGKIVTSLVADMIMPPVGMLLGKVNFTDLKLTIGAAPKVGQPAVTINYGNFLQSSLDFLIVAAAVFLIIKAINKFKRVEAVDPDVPKPLPPQEQLLTEIRDLLREVRDGKTPSASGS